MSYYIRHISKIESTREKTKVFHSFRHLVRTRLVEEGIDERVIDSIVGHSNRDRSVGSSHYTHSEYVHQKIDAMKKLKYDVDFKKIKRWDYCKFSRL
jgi:intergrase/recombinase